MKKQYIVGVLLGITFIGLLTLMLKKKDPAPLVSADKIQVSTSFYPLYFFASQIGGDKAEVSNVTPAGAEPHDFEPTAEDMAHIQDSKLLILNGGSLEPWGEDVTKNSSLKTSIVVAGEDLTNQKVVEEGEEITDPHIWLSPILAEKMVDKITEGFEKVDAGNKDYYISNANALKGKLAELDGLYQAGLKTCLQKNIITSHFAFGYLATAYGLKQVPIAGLSPDAEPSSKELVDIAKFAKANNIKYIFFESLASPKLSQTLASEIGAQTLVLNPIEGLTPEEVSQGKDYFTEMKSNLNNLEIALQCSK